MKNILLCLILASFAWLPAAAQKHHSSHRASTTTKGYGEKSSAQSTAAPSGLPNAHKASASKELAKTEAQSNRLLASSNQGKKTSGPKAPGTAIKAPKSERNATMNFQYKAPKTHTNSSGRSGTRGRKVR